MSKSSSCNIIAAMLLFDGSKGLNSMSLRSSKKLAAVTFILLALAHAPPALGQADPDALKKIVRDKCLPNHEQGKPPAPCVEINVEQGVDKGYAILKDRNGATQYLLITTGIVTGVEDVQLLQDGSPNYWAHSWEARKYVEQRADKSLPRDVFSLALNSSYGRTQNQYHIHVDCVQPEVRRTLMEAEDRIGETWTKLETPLYDHPYFVMKVKGDVLSVDPHKLVAARSDVIGMSMGRQTIVVIGASFKDGAPGFYILTDSVNIGAFNRASGEELQDHACKLADGLP